MIKITITECYGLHRSTTLRARTDDLEIAVQRAVRKHAPTYKSRVRFVRDNGISVGANALVGTQYGQIGHVERVGCGINMDTGRVSIKATKE